MRGARGFTLVELLVSMAIVLVIMGGTLTVIKDASRAAESTNQVLGLNNNLRVGTDLLVRVLIQVGQGLPTGRTVQVPNGHDALVIRRPAPLNSVCTTWPSGTQSIQAVTPGPACGPVINGVATDVTTTLAVDSVLEAVPVQGFNLVAHTATVSLPAQTAGGLDISTGGPDDVRVGDLVMFTKGSASALAYVTAVDGGQALTFGNGDPMNLNQFDDELNGTVNDLATLAPTTANAARLSRVRMITYYLDVSLDPTAPRLIRHMGWGDPAVAANRRGQTVAFGIENLQFTYDMVDGAGNPANVRMVARDLTAAGACAPNPCSANQIRKVNIFLSGRSRTAMRSTRQVLRNRLTARVGLRNLAFANRYVK